jgi:enoyl-CoA hydratase
MTAVTLRVAGHVAEVILDRPDALNAFDAEMHEEFAAVLRDLAHIPDVRAAVIGSSGAAFSAGGDMEFLLQVHDDIRLLLRGIEDGRAMLHALLDLPFPVIAAVQGPAAGLGATIALACDMIVAARAAWFADPHVQVGLAAGDGGCLVWPQALGSTRAKRYLLTGDRLSAEDAHAFGVVTDLVDEPDAVLPAARALAERVAGLAPLAVQGTKRALGNAVKARAAEVVDLAFGYEARSALSDDLVEAVSARRERRPASYTGR